MPIRTNRFYNDPNIGAAFENIASIFAPPSAQDTAAYAMANAKNAEAKRLADFYATATNPDTDWSTIDRFGVGAGAFNPTQTMRSVEMGDATTRRGQDVTASTQRYGYDRSFDASTQNNVRDNARALTDREMQEAGAMSRLGVTDATDRRGQDIVAATSRGNNEADNVRALEAAKLAGVADLYGTVAQDAIRPAVPANVAGMFGLPEAVPEVAGRTSPLSADQVVGQAIAAMPRETVEGFARDKYAPTETQVQGQERRGLTASGALTQDDLVQTIMGDVPVEQVVGKDGRPEIVSRADAVGRQPFVNRSSEPAPKVENWIGPDGKGGIAMFDRERGQFVDTTTKQPLPAGSRTYTGQLTGGSEATGFGKTTEAQDKNAYAATMAEAPTNRLLKAFDTKQLPSTADYVIFNAMKNAPTIAAPALVGQMSESGQLFYQDLRTALPFQLMTQSGAAVTEQEYDRKLLELIPVPGEAQGVTDAKRQQFATYIKAVRGVSGAAYDKIHAGGDIATPALPGAPASATPAPAAPPAPAGGPVRVSSPDEARKLPSGTAIILPDGSEGRVP